MDINKLRVSFILGTRFFTGVNAVTQLDTKVTCHELPDVDCPN